MLAFRNAEVIGKLRQRGLAIKNEDWDGARKLDQEINACKNAKFEDLVTPCSVFMTF